jgi:hypothetical protein
MLRCQVTDLMVPLLKFYFHEEVRRAAVAALPHLLRSAQAAAEKGVPGASKVSSAPVPLLPHTRLCSSWAGADEVHHPGHCHTQGMAPSWPALMRCITLPGSHISEIIFAQSVAARLWNACFGVRSVQAAAEKGVPGASKVRQMHHCFTTHGL